MRREDLELEQVASKAQLELQTAPAGRMDIESLIDRLCLEALVRSTRDPQASDGEYSSSVVLAIPNTSLTTASKWSARISAIS